jgi:hypothetical protein
VSIIHGNANDFETDALTVGGQKLVIKATDHGFYYLDVSGVGGRPKIAEQLFTSLFEVRKARDAYIQTNLKQITKMKFIEEMATKPSIAERRKAERLAETED